MKNLKRDISFFDEVKSFFELVKIIRKEKPAVLHLNSSKMGFVGGLAGRIAGASKIIFTAHGWAFNESRPWPARKFFKFLQWLTVLFSHTTIAVSEKTKNDIVGLPFLKKKVVVIHNGIGQIEFLDKQTAREKLSKVAFDTEEIWVGTISELHKNKGLDFLIMACANLPENVSVFIIGDGEEKEKLQNQIKKSGLENKIFLTGRIEKVGTLLKAFDIFTLTSRTEALPYTILEAGLAGCAVVVSRVGGIPEIIENEKSGILVEAGNIDQISKSLKNLLLEPQKRASLGANLQQKVSKDFSLQGMISKTEKIYGKSAFQDFHNLDEIRRFEFENISEAYKGTTTKIFKR
jgi:glycosyltransferase involved in cell wall biosynthesis